MSVRLSLFGSPTIDLGAGPATLPFERRSQLLVFLAVKRGWVGRAELASMFWPEQPQKLAYANLRKTLFRLQDVAWGAPVELDGQTARLDVATDVAAFETALHDGRGDEALALYRGDLLAGFDDAASEAWASWLSFERERLRSAWRDAALRRGGRSSRATRSSSRRGCSTPIRSTRRPCACTSSRSPAAARRAGRARRSAPSPTACATTSAWRRAPSCRRCTTRSPRAPPPCPPSPARAADDGFVGRSTERRHIASQLAEDDCRPAQPGRARAGSARRGWRAGRWPSSPAEFSDGAVFVALEDATTPAELFSRLAREAGIELNGRADPFEQAIESLRGLQLLLVLDNFEQLVAAAPQVETLLARCPRLRVLVTTRVRLGIPSEWLFAIEGLPVPDPDDEDHLESFDAVRLFVRAARRVEPAFAANCEPAALADICRQVGGLPLALEIAASWTRVLSCSAIAAELRQGTELLRAVDPTRPARQASIEVVFDHAWRLLSGTEREALARLSVFRGGFSAEAARAVAAPLPVLGALLDKSLLRKDEGRFYLHPLLQRLAADRLEEGAPARHRRSRARPVLPPLARAAAPGPVDDGERDALRQLELEFENARAAWQHLPAEGISAATLVGSALALMQYCDHRGRFADGLAVLGDALAAPASAATPGLRPMLQAAVAHLQYRLDPLRRGDRERVGGARRDRRRRRPRRPAAVLQGPRHLQLSPRPPRRGAPLLPPGARAGAGRGRSAQRRGDARQPRPRREGARPLRRGAQDVDRVAGAAPPPRRSGRRGALPQQPERAAERPRRLRERARQRPRQPRPVRAARPGRHAHLRALQPGRAVDEARRARRAHDHAARALEQTLAAGNRSTEAWIRLLLVQIAVRRGDLDAARPALRDSLELALAIGRPLSLLAAIAVFTDIVAAQGERRAAARLLRFAMAHPAMTVQGRDQLQPRLDALTDADAPADEAPWTAPELDVLARRIVAETPAAHAGLIASLRARA
jgi:predicted ATPase